MSEGNDARLSRVEAKIDRLTDIVIQLAKVEERQIFMSDGLKRLGERQDKHEDETKEQFKEVDKRLLPLEQSRKTVTWMERLIWLALTAVLTAYLS